MRLNKRIILVLLFIACVLYNNAQTLRQFSGPVSIAHTVITPGIENGFTLTISAATDNFKGENVLIGDMIIDVIGNSFQIDYIAQYASIIICTAKCLDGVDAFDGNGLLFRPTSKGLYLTGSDIPSNVLATAVNSSLLTLNATTPTYYSGSTLPSSSGYSVGDYLYNAVSAVVYELTSNGWSAISNIPMSYAYPATSESSAAAGTVVQNYYDQLYYECDGTASTLIASVNSLPVSYNYGDVYYTTSDSKLYMMGRTGNWVAISGSSIPSGPVSNRPASAITGDFYFDNVNNILYVYDSLARWVVVSINGSTPTGPINPDPSVTTVKEGELYYNSTDKKLYFYNGFAWLSISNSLTNGQIFIGNSSNVPVSVPLSGDATISSTGQLTIKNGAITNSKLDKANIPLDGFGIAQNYIQMGDGTNNYQIKHVAIPTLIDDAATKGFVDMLFATPTTLGLNNNSMFVGNALNKAIMVLKNAVPISDFGRATASVSMNPVGGPYANKITDLANPNNPQEAATKYYVDNRMITPSYITLANNQIIVGTAGGIGTAVLKSTVSFSDFGAATADVLMGGKNLKNLQNPVNPQDAATMNYVDSKTLSLTSNYVFQGDGTNAPVGVPKTSIHLNEWGAATATVNMGGTNLINLADPVALQDAATKKYVDGKNGSVNTSVTTPAVGTLGTTYYNTTDKIFYISDGSQWLPVNNILPTGQLYVGDASNKAIATPKSSIPLSGFGAPIADIAAGAFKITGLADPTNAQDASTKKYVDNSISGIVGSIPLAKGNLLVGNASNLASPIAKSAMPLSGFADADANISMGTGSNNYKIINVANPTGDQDAATKYYVDKKVITPTSITLTTDYILVGNASNQATAVAKSNVSLSEFGAITGNLSLAGYQITNMADPVTAQDAVTKKYVDNSLASFSSIPALTQGYLFVGDATNKALGTAKNAIPLSGFAAAVADVDLGTHKLVNLVDPSANQDAATKNYVDTKPVNPANITLSTGKIFVGNASGKAAETLPSTISLSAFGLPTADVDLGTHKLVNVVDPISNQDASSKKYVDTQVAANKLAPIGTNTMLGNNTALTTDAIALTPLQVKTMLSLNNVDNTSDATKSVLSATKLTTTIKINGVDFDGSTNITIPGDNMGNHTATQNIKTVTFAINSDGVNGKGLTFDTPGNATFGQDVTVNGNFYTPSDQRLKKNIETLGNALQSIDSMRGVRFEYRDQKKYAKGPKIGVIAQELMKVFPEMVTKGTDGFYKVDYTQLSAVLIQAVREQQTIMHQQQLEINELKIRLDNQQMQINAILKKIE